MHLKIWSPFFIHLIGEPSAGANHWIKQPVLWQPHATFTLVSSDLEPASLLLMHVMLREVDSLLHWQALWDVWEPKVFLSSLYCYSMFMILSMCNNAVINHSGFLFHVGAAVCGTWKYPSNSSFQWEHLKVQSLHSFWSLICPERSSDSETHSFWWMLLLLTCSECSLQWLPSFKFRCFHIFLEPYQVKMGIATELQI